MNDNQSTIIKAEQIPKIFELFYTDLLRICKWAKYYYEDMDDTFYTAKDLLNDSFFVLLSAAKTWNTPFNDFEHFKNVYIKFVKKLYFSYLKNYRYRHIRYSVWVDLQYRQDTSSTIDELLDVYAFSHVDPTNLHKYINNLEYEEDKIIIESKLREKSNEWLARRLKCDRNNLRSKIFRARKRFFKYLQSVGDIPKGINYDDLPKYSKAYDDKYTTLGDEYYINNYPFEQSYEDQMERILEVYDGETFEMLCEICRKNSVIVTKQSKKDLRMRALYGINMLWKKNKVFYIDDRVYTSKVKGQEYLEY